MSVSRSPAAAADRYQLIAELTREGWHSRAIARCLGVSERMVWRARRRHGLAKPLPRPITADEIEQARVMLEDGASYAEVARTLGRSAAVLVKRLPGYAMTKQQAAQRAVLGRAMARVAKIDVLRTIPNLYDPQCHQKRCG